MTSVAAQANGTKLHAEVVGLVISASSVPSLAAAYWNMLVVEDCSHANDRDPNCRAVIGLPGGMESALLPGIKAVQLSPKFELWRGAGDDADTLG